mmetsp:Transcript_16331/g.48971  ORF Transcript_16331/g.48971 Transcript_16331/m.48971 type:complete len:213 (+) Transcript_16331:449-1087(+)
MGRSLLQPRRPAATATAGRGTCLRPGRGCLGPVRCACPGAPYAFDRAGCASFCGSSKLARAPRAAAAAAPEIASGASVGQASSHSGRLGGGTLLCPPGSLPAAVAAARPMAWDQRCERPRPQQRLRRQHRREGAFWNYASCCRLTTSPRRNREPAKSQSCPGGAACCASGGRPKRASTEAHYCGSTGGRGSHSGAGNVGGRCGEGDASPAAT